MAFISYLFVIESSLSLGDACSSCRQALHLSSHGFQDHSGYIFHLGNPLVDFVVNLTGFVIS